jgi:hypothetical protein
MNRIRLFLTMMLVPAAAICAAAPGPAPSLAPSASRIGINLSAPADWNTEIPFADVFRLSRPWISQKKGGAWGTGPALELDKDGWVKRLAPDTWAETLLLTIDGGRFPQGQYVVLYDGAGQVEFTGLKRVVSRAPGRIVIEPSSSGGFTLQVRATEPANYVRNIRVLLPGTEATAKDNPWNPAFLARWSSVNTLRFMDWMLTNSASAVHWAERPTPSLATFAERGVPVELMVDLANRLGANPWFCIPHTAADDYVRSFAELVKKTLRPDLTPYIELSNEIWNFGFPQTQYAADRGTELGLADKPWEAAWRWSSRRSVEVFKTWESVYGGPGRFVRVMASQAANAYIADVKLSFEEAWRHVDALAIAPYFTFNVAPDGTPGPAEVAGWSPSTLLARLGSAALPEAEEWMRANADVARQYKVRLVAYEGGQHLVGVGGTESNDALTALFAAANRDPVMGALYARYLDTWKAAAGGDLFCLFTSVEAWTRWGSWGLIEHAQDDTPKLRAVLAWNAANPRTGP